MADQKISELSAITTLDGTEEFVVADGGFSKKILASDVGASLGGGDYFSPADAPPASPDSFNDEFDDSTSLSNWTAFGDSPDAESIDTAVSGRLYVQRNALNAKYFGRYKAISTTGRYEMCLGATNAATNYQRGGGMVILPTGAITNSSPCVYFGYVYENGYDIMIVRNSALATWAATVNEVQNMYTNVSRVYLLAIFASATSVALYYSFDGIAWRGLQGAYNPGWNMDKIGWAMNTEGAAGPVYFTANWFRKTA